MCDEQVAATLEAKGDEWPEQLVRPQVEGRRLARQPARDRRAPLLPHATGLDARRTGRDPASLEHRHPGAPMLQLVCDREPDHAGSDHGDVKRLPAHRTTLTAGAGARKTCQSDTVAMVVVAHTMLPSGTELRETR